MRPTSIVRGYTYIELVVTIAIVGTLAAITAPVIETQVARSKEAELRAALREMRRAIDAYKLAWDQGRIERKLDQSGYPPTLAILVEGVVDARSAKKEKMYFLRRIPADPFSDRPTVLSADPWGRRSYRSDPDSPEEGEDVFDVYSLSARVGLNGVPYRKW